MKLLDNYERSTGVSEKVTDEEIAENNAFLDAILDTAVMKVKKKQSLLSILYKCVKLRNLLVQHKIPQQ